MPEVKLPPFRSIAQQFQEAFRIRVHRAVREQGIASQIDVHVIQEGRSAEIQRSTSDVPEATEMVEGSHEITFSNAEIESVSLVSILQKITELAEAIRTHQHKHLFQVLHEVTERTGQVVRAEGRPLDAEMILQVMETMPPTFDPLTGEQNAVIVIHPDMQGRLREVQSQVESDPELTRRFQELEQRKRNEFRKEEMDRELAG